MSNAEDMLYYMYIAQCKNPVLSTDTPSPTVGSQSDLYQTTVGGS